MKSAKDYLSEANSVVPKLPSELAIKQHGKSNNLFIDVRDSDDIARTGTVTGALRIPRGFIEFAADESVEAYNPALKKDSNLFLICAAGGQAALAGKTLVEMGYKSVTNIGGIGDWKDAGGPVEA